MSNRSGFLPFWSPSPSRESRRTKSNGRSRSPWSLATRPTRKRRKAAAGGSSRAVRIRAGRPPWPPGCRRGSGASAPRQASPQLVRLFLAVGDLEGLRSRSAEQYGDRLLHHRGRLFEWARLSKDARYLRRTCDEIWVIDCSPEGHQPEVNTRIFQAVQQPVCIVLASRSPSARRKARRGASLTASPRDIARRSSRPWAA